MFRLYTIALATSCSTRLPYTMYLCYVIVFPVHINLSYYVLNLCYCLSSSHKPYNVLCFPCQFPHNLHFNHWSSLKLRIKMNFMYSCIEIMFNVACSLAYHTSGTRCTSPYVVERMRHCSLHTHTHTHTLAGMYVCECVCSL